MADPGTVSVAAASAVVTGTLTSFVAAEGDIIIIGADVGVVKSRDSTTQITLKQPWAGAGVASAANWIVLPVGPSWYSQVALNLRLSALLAKWESGPIKWDQAGSLAQRASYNGQAVGFTYLAIDPLPFMLYVKLANTGSASDWSNGQQIYQKADSTAAAEAARDAAASSASSASSSAAAAAGSASSSSSSATSASNSASAAASSASSAQTSANNASATLANAALKGDNADISRLRGIGGAGIDFWASETAVTGQGTCDLSAVTTLKVAVTLSGPITSFGTGAHRFKVLRFANVGQLTNGAQLSLQGGANITTAVGDRALFVSDANGVGYIIGYWRADGTPVAVVPVAGGGTGAVTATAARSSLGAAASGANGDITSLSGLTTALSIAQGGHGGKTAAAALSNLGAQAALGYTPVQQGGGTGQSASNKIYLGWSGSMLKAMVDTLDLGRVWTDNDAASTLAASGCIRIPVPGGGVTIQWGTSNAANSDQGINFRAAFSAAPWAIVATADANGGPNGTAYTATADQVTASSFAMRVRSTSGGSTQPASIAARWLAIGPT